MKRSAIVITLLFGSMTYVDDAPLCVYGVFWLTFTITVIARYVETDAANRNVAGELQHQQSQ